jgi:hypothetical protein
VGSPPPIPRKAEVAMKEGMAVPPDDDGLPFRVLTKSTLEQFCRFSGPAADHIQPFESLWRIK